MKKFQLPISIGAIGGLAGVIIAEFFPKLLNLGLLNGTVAALSDPFSQVRNELALKYGGAGLAIGAVIGIILMIIRKK